MGHLLYAKDKCQVQNDGAAMEAEEYYGEAANFITRDFHLQRMAPLAHQDAVLQLEEIKSLLIRKIEELLDFDFERLMNILYRIDVDENKVKETFKNHRPNEIAPILADLVIKRQIQKVKTRHQG
jgi:hypothetical protein